MARSGGVDSEVNSSNGRCGVAEATLITAGTAGQARARFDRSYRFLDLPQVVAGSRRLRRLRVLQGFGGVSSPFACRLSRYGLGAASGCKISSGQMQTARFRMYVSLHSCIRRVIEDFLACCVPRSSLTTSGNACDIPRALRSQTGAPSSKGAPCPFRV